MSIIKTLLFHFLLSWLAKKLSLASLIKLGGLSIGLGGALMFVLASTSSISSWQVLLPMAVITLGVTTARASAITGALAPIPSQAGQGSAGSKPNTVCSISNDSNFGKQIWKQPRVVDFIACNNKLNTNYLFNQKDIRMNILFVTHASFEAPGSIDV